MMQYIILLQFIMDVKFFSFIIILTKLIYVNYCIIKQQIPAPYGAGIFFDIKMLESALPRRIALPAPY